MNDLKPYLAQYTQLLQEKGESNESYKWDAINHFQENWDINADDFEAMFLESFRKVSNLLYQNSWGFIKKALSHYDEVVRGMFKRLYDESKPLSERILEFENKSEELVEPVKKAEKNNNLNAQQDERTISVYLSFMYPEKYFIYMYSFYENICDCLNEPIRDKGERFLHYIDIAEQTKRNLLIDNEDILELHNITFPQTDWNDINLITQNFFFSIFRKKEKYQSLKNKINKLGYYSIFFGKITNHNNQLDEKFYFADEKSWFGDLKEGDYVFVIGGQKIRLWKASSWNDSNGFRMDFKEVIEDLNINTKDIQALKFFKLNIDLIIKTSRSTAKSRRAFFEITTHKDFNKDNLLNLSFYKDQLNYRQTKVVNNEKSIPEEEFDIQIIKQDTDLKIQLPLFSDDLGTFIDNTRFIGQGQINKDKTLKKVIESDDKSWNHRKISMINLYDAFYCNYNVDSNEDEKYTFLVHFSEWLDERYYSDTHFYLLNQTRLFLDELISNKLIVYELLNTLDNSTLLNLINILEESEPLIEKIDYLFEFLKEKTMSKIEFFEKYKKYLIQERSTEISQETINSYYENAIKDSPDWMKRHGVNFDNIINNNKTEFIKLKEAVKNSQSGFGGFASFKEFVLNHINESSTPLNQIFYGPPGTGKTYRTKKVAVEIIEGKIYSDSKEDRKIILEKYEDFLEKKLVNFTTFHQSMSYEDFVEGIKPVMSGDDEDIIKYEVKNGIFKQFCSMAKGISGSKEKDSSIDFSKVKYFKMSLGGKNRPDTHNWCIENNKIGLGWGDNEDYSSYDSITDWYQFRDKFKEDFPYLVESSKFHIQAVYAFQNMKKGDIVLISKGNHILDAIGIIEGDYEYDPNNQFGLYHLREVKWLATEMNASPELFLDVNISQQAIYGFNKQDVKIENFTEYFHKPNNTNEKNKHVLIIDEINRGNVSAIFGELITQIEKDKRIGAKEKIEVMLPYSKEYFGVPDNVYIIGTMNTADRSVEALDTALRRRFSFVEVVPDTTALKNAHNTDGIISHNGQDINLNKLLDTINGRIELLIDKDHKIGHSYFINVQDFEELTQTFSNKVIPLLEEYFYGDFGKIGLVLGKAFISDENQKLKKVVLANFDHDDREIFNDKKLFCLTELNSWKPISFQSIYDNSIRIDE